MFDEALRIDREVALKRRQHWYQNATGILIELHLNLLSEA